MENKLLIVNGFHQSWRHVPMGSFGICNYLEQKGIKARIFNCSIYSYSEHLSRLQSVISSCKPSHVGIVIHWKELLENALYISFFIKQHFPHITIIAGGMTAGYFSKQILSQFREIDFIIRGDAEKTLELLLRDHPLINIPNLVYRDEGKIRSNNANNIDQKTLDSISFTNLSYLYDFKKYIRLIGSIPLMIGRGCCYECLHCGGSKYAFHRHSDRREVILRSIDSVIDDLKQLTRYTKHIYIDHDTSDAYMCDLFSAISSNKSLSKKIFCDYTTWRLLDGKLLSHYEKAFRVARNKNSILISPETTFDKDRLVIKGKTLSYSNAELRSSITNILNALNNKVTINIFFSRYHKTQTKKKLMNELVNIHSLREDFYLNDLQDVVAVIYTDLATDPGSRYWKYAFSGKSKSYGLAALLAEIKNSKLASNTVDENIILYRPSEISDDFASKYSMLCRILYFLAIECTEYYFWITKIIGPEKFINGLMHNIDDKRISLIGEIYDDLMTITGLNENVKLYNPFFTAAFRNFLDTIHELFVARNSDLSNTKKRICSELIAFSKWMYLRNEYDCLESSAINYVPAYASAKPVLDQINIMVTHYDFMNKEAYRVLNSDRHINYRSKVIYVHKNNSFLKLNYKPSFRYLSLLNGRNAVKDILGAMERDRFLNDEDRYSLKQLFVNYLYFITK